MERAFAVSQKTILLKCHKVDFNLIQLILLFIDLFAGVCLSSHSDFAKLIDDLVLEINLKLIWSCGVFETETQDLNFVNYRYAAYCALDMWLGGKKKMGRGVGRSPLPSCLVSAVREKYPDEDEHYTGFLDKSPVFKKRKK